MLKEFRDFAVRGNAIDLAIGIIIGAAFNGIVSSLVNDIIMPPIGFLMGKVDLVNRFIDLRRHRFETLAQAKAAGDPTINYGIFLNEVISFVITALALFFLIRCMNIFRHRQAKQEEIPPPPLCPYCKTEIKLDAIRCPACTSDLRGVNV
ncbi:large conductance mechanosensitive channel protein MscL [Candidatus Parcubacteria bacterium]|nr:large conductance mechanosensitive channel protein MscL [Candidatus Parcubacteria bacterium]